MKNILTLLFTLLSFITYAQLGKIADFDVADFNKKTETAKWLCEYDDVAWKTSDKVLTQDKNEIAKLGNEWFCYQDKQLVWNAVYGKYANDSFNLVFHFIIDSNSIINWVYDKVDTGMTNSYSRALITAQRQLKGIKDSISINFNQYIKQNEDQTFTVWILPAFQKDYMAIYGGEFIYTIDRSGNRILKDDSYYSGNFRGFKVDVPREIRLNYDNIDKPTLGGVFFVWYYKQYFTKIVLSTRKNNSSVIQNSDKSYSWITTVIDDSKNK